MARIFIFTVISMTMFFGLINILPLFEGDEDLAQYAAAIAYIDAYPAVSERLFGTTCVISVHPEEIASGESASVAWFSKHAVSASLASVGPVPLEGGMFVTPLASETYTLNVLSSSGQAFSCDTRVTVQ